MSQNSNVEMPLSQHSLENGTPATPVPGTAVQESPVPATPLPMTPMTPLQHALRAGGIMRTSQQQQQQQHRSNQGLPGGAFTHDLLLRRGALDSMSGVNNINPNVNVSEGVHAVSSGMNETGATARDHRVMHPDLPEEERPNQNPAAGQVIWGTNINVEECHTKLGKFLREFRSVSDALPSQSEHHGSETNNEDSLLPRRSSQDRSMDEEVAEDGDQPLPTYHKLLLEQLEIQGSILNVNLAHLKAFDPALYRQLVNYPSEILPVFDFALDEFANELRALHSDIAIDDQGSQAQQARLQIRTFGLDDREVRSMRELDPSNINQMIGLRGMVVRCSQVIPDLIRACYRCSKCLHAVEVDVERGRIEEPSTCTNASCQLKGGYTLIHNRCEFSDKQVIRLQEAPESVPQGETPATVSIMAYDSLVDCSKPGDRVEITGILRAVPIRVNPRLRTVRSVFRMYVDLIHLRNIKNTAFNSASVAGENGVQEDGINPTPATPAAPVTPDSEANPTPNAASTQVTVQPINEPTQLVFDEERKKQFHEIATGLDVYERLTDSLAPSIWGMRDLKKGVLLQLFGGREKDMSSQGRGKCRADINVLVVGDPGVSKSQVLQAVHRLAPRGVYTSGRGSSAVGLTAYVTKDPDTRDFVLESGALVLSDGGICCIDEFDKMNEHTRSILHEVMEQQTVSIAKAGIVATLNARTSILAAANPVESRFNRSLSIVENIQLPPTLLSRFDLIFLMLDQPQADDDKRLARHLVSMFYKGAVANQQKMIESRRIVDQKLLGDYIAYARQNIHPVLSPEAGDCLVEKYVTLRHPTSEQRRGTITATTRQLESMIRLAEASARLRLSTVVEAHDVDEAFRLMAVAMQQAATDQTTGLIDIDLLMTGRSNAARQMLQQLSEAIMSVVQTQTETGRDANIALVLRSVREHSTTEISDHEFREALAGLRDEERLIFVNGGQSVRIA